MSVHDETWDRPICNYCHHEIPYGQSACHRNGECTIIRVPRTTDKDMNNTCITCGNSFETTFKILRVCPTCVDYLIDMYQRIDQEQNMNTSTTNTQTLSTINQIADEIVDMIEQLGFTTDREIEPGYLKLVIVEKIKRNLFKDTDFDTLPNCNERTNSPNCVGEFKPKY